MEKIYIKGNARRGKDVIKTLEKFGGVNVYNFKGEYANKYYFVSKDGLITNTRYSRELINNGYVKYCINNK